MSNSDGRDVLVLPAPKTKRDLISCLAQLILFVVVCVIGSSVLINVGRSAVEHARLSGGNMLKRHEASRPLSDARVFLGLLLTPSP